MNVLDEFIVLQPHSIDRITFYMKQQTFWNFLTREPLSSWLVCFNVGRVI